MHTFKLKVSSSCKVKFKLKLKVWRPQWWEIPCISHHPHPSSCLPLHALFSAHPSPCTSCCLLPPCTPLAAARTRHRGSQPAPFRYLSGFFKRYRIHQDMMGSSNGDGVHQNVMGFMRRQWVHENGSSAEHAHLQLHTLHV